MPDRISKFLNPALRKIEIVHDTSELRAAKAKLAQEEQKNINLQREFQRVNRLVAVALQDIQRANSERDNARAELADIKEENNSLLDRLEGAEDDLARLRQETASEIKSLRESLDTYRGWVEKPVLSGRREVILTPIKHEDDEDFGLAWPAESESSREGPLVGLGTRGGLKNLEGVEVTRIANHAKGSSGRGRVIKVQARSATLDNNVESEASYHNFIPSARKPKALKTSSARSAENFEVLKPVDIYTCPKPAFPVATVLPTCAKGKHSWIFGTCNGSERTYICNWAGCRLMVKEGKNRKAGLWEPRSMN